MHVIFSYLEGYDVLQNSRDTGGVHFRLVQSFLEFYTKSTVVALDPCQSFIVIECGKLENRY